MECISKATGRLKKKFNTFDEAFSWACKINKKPRTIHKQVAYKCKQCYKFHVGKSKHNTLLQHNINIYNNEYSK